MTKYNNKVKGTSCKRKIYQKKRKHKGKPLNLLLKYTKKKRKEKKRLESLDKVMYYRK